MRGGSGKPPEFEVHWTSQAQQDRKYWQKQDRRFLIRIDRLVADIQDHPFNGTRPTASAS